MSDDLTQEDLKRRVAELELEISSLRTSEKRLESIFRASPTGIGLVSDRRLLEVNDLFCQMTGFSRAELIGQNARILYPSEEEYERVGREKYELIKAYGTGTLETVMQRKDGELIDVLMSSTPLDRDDFSIGVTFTALDITARKKAEAERARLEAKVNQTQKVEAVGQLAGGVAHDLNNLLSPIIGFTELLLADTGQRDPRRKSLEQIMKAGIGARDLVRQLLAFSRKQTLEYAPLDLNETLDGFESLLRRTIREDVEIQVLKSEDLLPVLADLGQVEQVIMNLAVNAADAMPGGGRLVMETRNAELDEEYVRHHPGARPGSYVLMIFSDTGHGMDAETCDRIFDPFFSTKGALGTGLGLATVYGIVKQHGGNIWVHSEPGKGTTFNVYLPVAREAAPADLRQPALAAGVEGTETILLVEDNDQVRLVTEAILVRKGYTVLAAAGGQEAHVLLAGCETGVDLLLTDVIMPEVNGPELHLQLAAVAPGLKALYMSGYSDNVIAHHGLGDRGVQFIQKPFTGQTLGLKVREVLEG